MKLTYHIFDVCKQQEQTCFLKQLANFDIIGITNQAQFVNSRQWTTFKIQRRLRICPLRQSRLRLFTTKAA